MPSKWLPAKAYRNVDYSSQIQRHESPQHVAVNPQERLVPRDTQHQQFRSGPLQIGQHTALQQPPPVIPVTAIESSSSEDASESKRTTTTTAQVSDPVVREEIDLTMAGDDDNWNDEKKTSFVVETLVLSSEKETNPTAIPTPRPREALPLGKPDDSNEAECEAHRSSTGTSDLPQSANHYNDAECGAHPSTLSSTVEDSENHALKVKSDLPQPADHHNHLPGGSHQPSLSPTFCDSDNHAPENKSDQPQPEGENDLPQTLKSMPQSNNRKKPRKSSQEILEHQAKRGKAATLQRGQSLSQRSVHEQTPSASGDRPMPGRAVVELEYNRLLYTCEGPAQQVVPKVVEASGGNDEYDPSKLSEHVNGYDSINYEVLPSLPHQAPRKRATRKSSSFGACSKSWAMSNQREENKIMVGPQYQCSIPTIEPTKKNRQHAVVHGVCLWDPVKAELAERRGEPIRAFLDRGWREGLPFEQRLSMMEALHVCKYNVKDAMNYIGQADGRRPNTPLPSSEARSYRQLVSRAGDSLVTKNFQRLAQNLGCPMKTVLISYYRWKASDPDGYRMLKAKLHLEPNECTVCHDGGDLVLCDQCNGAYHWETCIPQPLEKPPSPEEAWYCYQCVKGTPVKRRRVSSSGGKGKDATLSSTAQAEAAVGVDKLALLRGCHIELRSPINAMNSWSRMTSSSHFGAKTRSVASGQMIWDAKLGVYRYVEPPGAEGAEEQSASLCPMDSNRSELSSRTSSCQSIELSSDISSCQSRMSSSGTSYGQCKQHLDNWDSDSQFSPSNDSTLDESDAMSEWIPNDDKHRVQRTKNRKNGHYLHALSQPLCTDEYMAHVPIGSNGLLGVTFAQTFSGRFIFHQYRGHDGLASLAEKEQIFKNPGDQVLAIAGLSTKNKSFDELVGYIQGVVKAIIASGSGKLALKMRASPMKDKISGPESSSQDISHTSQLNGARCGPPSSNLQLGTNAKATMASLRSAEDSFVSALTKGVDSLDVPAKFPHLAKGTEDPPLPRKIINTACLAYGQPLNWVQSVPLGAINPMFSETRFMNQGTALQTITSFGQTPTTLMHSSNHYAPGIISQRNALQTFTAYDQTPTTQMHSSNSYAPGMLSDLSFRSNYRR